MPSPETLDFLGQWLAGREESERTHCTTALTALAADAPAGRADAAAVLAFAYCLDAIHRGRPSHAPARSVLAGADLTGANLSGAELHVSSLNGTDLRRAELTGAVLRGCDLTGARWTGSHASTTQAMLCRPAGDARRKGWLVAPTATRRRAGVRLSSFTGHTGWLTAGAWSPDNTRILTTSSDGTARIWDANASRPAGWRLEQLPAGELAVFSAGEDELFGATPEAWRWLGWLAPRAGRLDRLPAETWGPIPPLSPSTTPTLRRDEGSATRMDSWRKHGFS